MPGWKPEENDENEEQSLILFPHFWVDIGETKKLNDLYNPTAESIIETINFSDRQEGIKRKET